ncbi:protein MAIN-LIKE 1-like [Vicia villosa]|uniref:protein MAIN-LIKE 1-like n=1 Tax=Vicia villosa TaxID=3911 RepID=UPI00273CAD57|nr:protein MAIN-LIKE 1-like [Vicia villosa]
MRLRVTPGVLPISPSDHIARHVWNEEERLTHKFYNHDRKILSLQQSEKAWFQDVLIASTLRDLCEIWYIVIHNVMLMAFAERWHPKTSSFHLTYGEITVTLDDVSCLLHIPIRGTILRHGRITKEEARELLVEELGLIH